MVIIGHVVIYLFICPMKHIALAIILLMLGCKCQAQEFGSTILQNSPFKNTFNSSSVEDAISELSSIYKVEDGKVTFTIIVDSLPLSSSEILDYAKEYLEEVYQHSKYEIVHLNTEKSLVIGSGEFFNFEQYAIFPNQYSFTCKHFLRIDTKEGRARLCVYADEYDIRRTNGNIYEQKDVKITDVAPLNPDNGKAEKMYKKAFLAFAKLVVYTLYELRDELKSKQETKVEEW